MKRSRLLREEEEMTKVLISKRIGLKNELLRSQLKQDRTVMSLRAYTSNRSHHYQTPIYPACTVSDPTEHATDARDELVGPTEVESLSETSE